MKKKKAISVCTLVILSSLFSHIAANNQEGRRILFDEYHSSVKAGKFSTFLSELQSMGYTTEFLEGPIDSSTLTKDSYDVLYRTT